MLLLLMNMLSRVVTFSLPVSACRLQTVVVRTDSITNIARRFVIPTLWHNIFLKQVKIVFFCCCRRCWYNVCCGCLLLVYAYIYAHIYIYRYLLVIQLNVCNVQLLRPKEKCFYFLSSQLWVYFESFVYLRPNLWLVLCVPYSCAYRKFIRIYSDGQINNLSSYTMCAFIYHCNFSISLLYHLADNTHRRYIYICYSEMNPIEIVFLR